MNAVAWPAPLLFALQENRLAALDGLVRGLWLGGLTNAQGSVEARLAALAELRAALLAGELPPFEGWRWPPPAIARGLAEAMRALDLARYCRDEGELTDTVLMSLLFHVDFIVDYLDRGADEATAVAMAVDAFAADWQERCGDMDELADVFGMIPDDAKSTRWDRIRGLLRSEGWQEVMRIRRLLERLPELADLIRRLGRAAETDEPDEAGRVTELVTEEAIAHRAERSTVRVPDMPGETRGIHRADRVARMLPAEAMLLGHPRLRLVWHARRAERTLLCYEDDDRMQEIRRHEEVVQRPTPRPQPRKRLEMGPMLLCVDTSGSMRGGAEAVAKAAVLEAVRTAHAQKRACHVFSFGGPGEIVGMTLPVDADGIGRLARFLGQAFRGGTDVCAPIEAALAKLEEGRWQQADLVIMSDGEFGATPEVAARLRSMCDERGLRVQGVLVGDRETIGFLEVADDIFWVRDWRRYGGVDTESPLDSNSLTARFFPGALRTQANRDATISGATASLAVRAGRHRGDPQTENST
ncbi:VWA domain-containing protein [Aromatoleum petrolei]|uniref:VWA domain-containing protein n=1 Tax=Aromatoleum petrolei TaxID=76116 RepID=A0ABX1MSH9_9RHOO|nr:VWA domain-containing protein [Aromatoleum petrolei]NMF90738.1 VWA domain-containing protein [Aromatoleum petrolei]QTQ38403.1 VWA domain containing-protein, CoxE-like [Aromatoleum petrolei]